MALGQVLLLENKHAEYAELTTSTVAPLLVKLWKPGPQDLRNQEVILDPRWLFVHLAGLSSAPLYSPQFLAELYKESLQGLVQRWKALRERAPGDVPRLGADLFLHAAYRALGRQDERQEVARRIDQSPAAAKLLPKDGYEDLTKSMRKALAN